MTCSREILETGQRIFFFYTAKSKLALRTVVMVALNKTVPSGPNETRMRSNCVFKHNNYCRDHRLHEKYMFFILELLKRTCL